MPRFSFLRFVIIFLLLTGYAAPGAAQNGALPLSHHESLNSVLYVQSSVEYRATVTGLYALAKLRLDEALADPEWTAALEQIGDRGMSDLRPAVILDVDETVLDNSPFQARLIEDGTSFNSKIWLDWVDEERATSVPGALDFTRYAASRGVRVIYMTNRDASGEAATRRNLLALGFPLDEDTDTILTRGEKPEWAVSDKTPRRRFIADTYRILLLIGDNFGDFTSDSAGSLAERTVAGQNYASFWGRKWIVLPNPLYGSWEGALIGYKYGESVADRLRMKHELLQTAR